MAPAMLCKTSKKCKHGETGGKTNEIKSKLACISEASESTVWKNLPPNYHEDHIAGKGQLIHYNITIWYTNLFLCLELWRFPQQKQQWIKNGRNWKRFRRRTWRKSEARNRWSMNQGRRAQKFILHHQWTYVIWKMLNWRQSTKNTKVELYSEATLWKTMQGLTQYSLNKDHLHHKWQPPRSWISSPDCPVAMDKQQTQYRRIPK